MSELRTATFGGGCFWCIDAAFRRVKGVQQVSSGYSGGHVEHPTYHQICAEDTGHAEVVQLVYDEQKIDYPTLLKMFFALHDPTTLNRQGNDIGPQYRSVIFYHGDQQKHQAELVMERLQEHLDDAIVTELLPAQEFYPAESYHQDYFSANPRQPYCNLLIAPKIAKFEKEFDAYLV
ncbi:MULTISPECIES: peptide-methionine (S)-S-oxide reductase MsrA [unclassified Pseudoalteromonas]|uniref:peptide-methionine (S)-S-oxide reductase MsrA n=1 Tax=unclassified Pseudoalteromonas TaxID=194690 RepID=UPI000CF72EEB|nr:MULTISPECIES: peptide-methionine (S)-S-oxide reductase MsrA [unclassified Pseudoalteromonas]MBS3798370.1 peptide-methionine (S)-S-oxide reductase MsrA [Pseudoalteromonas sp. BDTF-M6]